MATSKADLVKSAKAEEEARKKLQERQQKEEEVHKQKIDSSADLFKNTRITSCSKVLQKNGQAVCMAFKNGAPKPVDLNEKKLQEVTSFS